MKDREKLMKFFKWLNDREELKYTELGIEFYVERYINETKRRKDT